MSVQSGILKYHDNEIHCLRTGNGPKVIIAFHGFGQVAAAFMPLSRHLPDDYTLVAIDLPGHGRSNWKDKYMRKKDLMAVVEGIKNDFAVERFSLLGNSIGSRVCLNIAEQQPNWVDKMVLLAPDGLDKNRWYRLATRNILGKAIFKSVLNKPEMWLKLLNPLQRYKIIAPSRFRFIQHYLSDTAAREKAAYVWPVTSKLVTHPDVVKWRLNKYKVGVDIFIGKHDPLFPVSYAEHFTRRLKMAHIHLLDCGHNVLTEQNIPLIAGVFK